MIPYPSLADLPPAPAGKRGWPWTAESPRAGAWAERERDWPTMVMVTPVLNQASFLEAAIRSVLLQGYPRLAYIIRDGGSTDGSLAIIRKYAPWLSGWVSEPDGGQYAAINAGFAGASGELMAWLNGDDMFAPGGLRTIGDVFAADGRVRWISGIPSVWNARDESIEVNATPRYNRFFLQRGCYEGRGLGWIQQESVFWRRDLWEGAGARVDASLRLAGDFELWLRFSRLAELQTVGRVVSGIRRHPGQRSADRRAYEAEVDACLARCPDRGRLARLVRRPGWRRAFRFWARRVGAGRLIACDPLTMPWRSTS